MTSAQRVVRLNSAVTRPAMVRTGNNAQGHDSQSGDADGRAAGLPSG